LKRFPFFTRAYDEIADDAKEGISHEWQMSKFARKEINSVSIDLLTSVSENSFVRVYTHNKHAQTVAKCLGHRSSTRSCVKREAGLWNS